MRGAAEQVATNKDLMKLILMRMSPYGFRRARLVCKMWRDVSLQCNEKWMAWLQLNGSRRIGMNAIHINTHCANPFKCNYRNHYALQSLPVHILKTVPLHEQVFRIGCSRRVKRLKSDYERKQKRIQTRAEELLRLKMDAREVQVEAKIGEMDYQALLKKRKV